MKLIKNPFVWIPVLVVVAGVAWWLGSPLFLTSRVDEPAPMMAAKDAMTADPMAKDAMATDTMTKDAMATDTMAKDAMAKDAMATDTMTKDPMATDTMAKDALAKDDMMKPMMIAGMFADGDSLHKASGQVSVIETSPGHQVLRFEQFKVTNGPDLFVMLTGPGMKAADGVNLGALKGSEGNQNYELPMGTDLMKQSRVVIWCRTFNVVFGAADLK